MYKLLIIALFLVTNTLFAQKIKIKKGVVSIDDKEVYLLDKKATLVSTDFTVSNLDGKPLLFVDDEKHHVYLAGPSISYFVIKDLVQGDSCVVDGPDFASKKRIVEMIEKYNLIKDGKLVLDAISILKNSYNQNMLEDFAALHPLDYDNLVERNSGPIEYIAPDKRTYKEDRKYPINAPGKASTFPVLIGYLSVSKIKYVDFEVFLPNRLPVAKIYMAGGLASKYVLSYTTIVDDKTVSPKTLGVQKDLLFVLQKLADQGYL